MLNRELIGKKYPERRFEVTVEAIRAYAAAVNEDNPRCLDDHSAAGMVAPPVFAVVAAGPAESAALADETLTGGTSEFFRRMVRGDNDIVWSDVLRPGDVLSAIAVVSGVEVKAHGELLRLDVTLRKRGREIARVGCGYFVRDLSPGKAASRPGTSPQPRGPVVAAIDMAVAPDQSLRYAKASGDDNPIHVDAETARLYGHPGILLQGSCTMAFLSKAVVDTFAGGDPARLRRLRVRYARPVLPGDTLTTIAWRLDEGTFTQQYGLEVKKQDGTVVIKNAFADVIKVENTITKSQGEA